MFITKFSDTDHAMRAKLWQSPSLERQRENLGKWVLSSVNVEIAGNSESFKNALDTGTFLLQLRAT